MEANIFMKLYGVHDDYPDSVSDNLIKAKLSNFDLQKGIQKISLLD